jgi:hypothetical protein
MIHKGAQNITHLPQSYSKTRTKTILSTIP